MLLAEALLEVAGVARLTVVEAILGLRCHLTWENKVLIGLSGIECEAEGAFRLAIGKLRMTAGSGRVSGT